MSARTDSLSTRVERLARLDDGSSQPYTASLRALQLRWSTSAQQPAAILVRRAFLQRNLISGAPSSVSRLINPRGHALRTALLMLFLAQTQAGRSPHILRVPLHGQSGDHVAWADLVVSGAIYGQGSSSRSPRELRAASARAAIDRLARSDVALVELLNNDRVGRYDRLRLMEDSGPRAIGAQLPYTMPSAKESVTIPVGFFVNGWIYALEDTEIATYLMYRSQCPADGGLTAITAGDRDEIYGVKRSAWEQYWVLVDSGILHLEPDPHRRPDGTYIDQGDGAHPLPHRFGLVDAGLAEDGRTQVLEAVRARAN